MHNSSQFQLWLLNHTDLNWYTYMLVSPIYEAIFLFSWIYYCSLFGSPYKEIDTRYPNKLIAQRNKRYIDTHLPTFMKPSEHFCIPFTCISTQQSRGFDRHGRLYLWCHTDARDSEKNGCRLHQKIKSLFFALLFHSRA